MAHAITIIIMFAPYTITNLYNRNAITEFYAVWFLYLGIGTWLLAIKESNVFKSMTLWTVCALSIIMMIGTHPITAQVGGVVFILIVLLTSRQLIEKIKVERKILVIGIGEIVLALCACSAWFYIVLIGGVKTLEVGAATGLKVIGNDFSETAYLTSLMPFPFDFRTLTRATGNVSTPYLDMQINVPLAVLYGVSLFVLLADRGVPGKKKVVSLLFLALSVMWLVFSSSIRLNTVASILFSHVQFAYRLITYIDLFITIGLLYNLMAIYSEPKIRRIGWLKVAMIVSITLACHDIMIQWTHIYAIHDSVSEEISVDNYPSTFMINGYVDHRYSMLSEEKTNNSIIASFGVDEKLNPRHITLSVDEKTVVVTDVQTSIYNKISANGKEIDALYFAQDGVFAFYIDPGVYELEYHCALPLIYLILRKIGQLSMLILALLCCGLYIVTIKRINAKR